ncbi:hypothetical protein G7Y89_g2401 [Cudoniella acicularis]|uniref:Uncharacterized protein n=1 Tax=Cudoniella acicularis TaxID=354080 RepID=A0A8H4W9E0_9HELO|nr:hypothetical protein G7Y89_g2401 [Cudoniella acicularis]
MTSSQPWTKTLLMILDASPNFCYLTSTLVWVLFAKHDGGDFPEDPKIWAANYIKYHIALFFPMAMSSICLWTCNYDPIRKQRKQPTMFGTYEPLALARLNFACSFCSGAALVVGFTCIFWECVSGLMTILMGFDRTFLVFLLVWNYVFWFALLVFCCRAACGIAFDDWRRMKKLEEGIEVETADVEKGKGSSNMEELKSLKERIEAETNEVEKGKGVIVVEKEVKI